MRLVWIGNGKWLKSSQLPPPKARCIGTYAATEIARNTAKTDIGRLRAENISKPSASIMRVATSQTAAATTSSASNTHKNQAGPEGHGPTASVRHQKCRKLKSVVPGQW